jgi:hypothetical protein
VNAAGGGASRNADLVVTFEGSYSERNQPAGAKEQLRIGDRAPLAVHAVAEDLTIRASPRALDSASRPAREKRAYRQP